VTDYEEPSVDWHLRSALTRSRAALLGAHGLWRSGFDGPALVWAVRSAEVLMRDYVLAPYFMMEGETWARSLKKGSRVLGSSNWAEAFAKAEEWWGPFDEAMTEDGRQAWTVWSEAVVGLRGDIVHGRAVPDVTHKEAADAIVFVHRMIEWYMLRFLASPKHPSNRALVAVLEDIRRTLGPGPGVAGGPWLDVTDVDRARRGPHPVRPGQDLLEPS
jgi:hypothetical protein